MAANPDRSQERSSLFSGDGSVVRPEMTGDFLTAGMTEIVCIVWRLLGTIVPYDHTIARSFLIVEQESNSSFGRRFTSSYERTYSKLTLHICLGIFAELPAIRLSSRATPVVI